MQSNHHEHSTDSTLLSDVAHVLTPIHQKPPGSFVRQRCPECVNPMG